MTAIDALDRPLQNLRISVIDACNFRCVYCMPKEKFPKTYSFIKEKDRLTFDEIIRLVKIFTTLGVHKVRITGGEPLLRRNLSELVEEISAIEAIDDLSLTTNGYWLEAHAQSLKDSGLQRVNVSLDALDDKLFGYMNGREYPVKRILAGIEKAQEVGLTPIKVNVLLQKGVNDHSVIDMVRHFKGSGVIVRFLEYMDVGNQNEWNFEQVAFTASIKQKIHEKYPLHSMEKNTQGEVAKRYRYQDNTGEIGFVSSITQPFCNTCNRVRISSDGKLYTCLFASCGIDLRKPMRKGANDGELKRLICAIWNRRNDRYSEERLERLKRHSRKEKIKKIEMYHIGG